MKKGDIFTMQWGYDQTNNTFYRVKALRGKTQAVIQEVDLAVKHCDGIGPMSADYEYDPKKYVLCNRSVFVTDNEKGRIVKIQKERWHPSNEEAQEGFYINHHFCSPYKGERLYESWYA